MEDANSSNKANFPSIPSVPKSIAPASSTIETNDVPQALPRTTIGLPPLPPNSASPYREQDHLMPIANIIRLMRRILPSHAKISDEAKETVQECVSEFISFITEEANERCHNEQRKTITADDLIWAMSKLGFDNYVEPLNLYLKRYREAVEGGSGTTLHKVRPRATSVVAPAVMIRAPMVCPNYPTYNPYVGYEFGFTYGLGTTVTTTTATSSVTPITMGRTPVVGMNPTYNLYNAGLGFKYTHDLSTATVTVTAKSTATTTTTVATVNSTNVGGNGGDRGNFGKTGNYSKDSEIGSLSNNDMLGFDDLDMFTFDVPSPDSTGTSNANAYKGDAHEAECFDNFDQFE